MQGGPVFLPAAALFDPAPVQVVIASRNADKLRAAREELNTATASTRVFDVACNIRKEEEV